MKITKLLTIVGLLTLSLNSFAQQLSVTNGIPVYSIEESKIIKSCLEFSERTTLSKYPNANSKTLNADEKQKINAFFQQVSIACMKKQTGLNYTVRTINNIQYLIAQ